MTTPRTRVALISCSASKADHATTVAKMYTSTLFHKSVSYANATCDRWLVLSAKHGLLAPDQVIEPYDQRLTVRPAVVNGRAIPTEWASQVSRQLLDEVGGVHPLWNTTFVVLAGGLYQRNLETLSSAMTMEFPLAGLQIGERLAWLTRAVNPPEPSPQAL